MGWVRDNFWEAGQLDANDPDGILKYYLDLIENLFISNVAPELTYQVFYDTIFKIPIRTDIERLSNLLDPDKCPVEFLPYLARLVGWDLRYIEPLFVDPTNADTQGDILKKRQQIKSALELRRVKGAPLSFKVLFESIGVLSLDMWSTWVKKSDPSIIQELRFGILPSVPEDWAIDSKLKLIFTAEDLAKIPGQDVNRILYRIDEIKPIHLLLYIIAAVTFTDFNADVVTIEDDLREIYISIGTESVGNQFYDEFSWQSGNCLKHSNNGIPPRRHDGAAIHDNGNGSSPNWEKNVDPFTGSSLTYHSDPYASLRGYVLFNNRLDILHNNNCNVDMLTVTDTYNHGGDPLVLVEV